MKDSLDQLGHAAVANPKVSTAVAAIAASQAPTHWFFDLLPDVLSIIASIVGIILALFILRYHWVNTKKVKLQVEKLELENEKLRGDKNG